MFRIIDKVQRWQSADIRGRSNTDLVDSLFEEFWTIPSIDGVTVDQREPIPDERGATALLTWQGTGSVELVDFWPDGTDEGLIPTDELETRPEFGDAYFNLRQARVFDRFLLHPLSNGVSWEIQGRAEIGKVTDPRNAMAAAVNDEDQLLRGYFAAVQKSAERLKPTLAGEIREFVSRRRERLSYLDEVGEALQLFPETRQQLRLATPKPNPHGHVLPPARLSDPSIRELHRTMVRWQQRVEQYGRSYRHLTEDQISDLLAVTLAMVFGAAEREVFCSDGKSDVYVPVKSIRDLTGTDTSADEGLRAFVIEAKIGRGPILAAQAIDQLMGYLPVQTPDAALAYYIKGIDGEASRERILTALRSRKDFLDEASEAEYELPILRFSREGDVPVRIAILIVQLGTDVPAQV